MNIDLVNNGISHLVLAVSATFIGTFHSPIPVQSTVVQTQPVIENQTYNPQEILPTTSAVNINVVGVGEGYNNFFPSVSPTPTTKLLTKSVPTTSAIPTITPPKKVTVTPQVSTIQTPTPIIEKKQEVTLNLPEQQPMAPMSSLNPDTILQLINQYRAGINLPALEKDEKLCKVAEYRKPQLYDEIFTSGTIHKGFYDLKLPYYIVENMASYGSEQANVSWWLGSQIHREAIEGDFKYSCGACAGNSCTQLFTNFSPKY